MSFFVEEESYYTINAKPNCKECDGKGIITYHVDQDWTERSPCYVCFPDDRGAKAAKAWWADTSKPVRPKEISYP